MENYTQVFLSHLKQRAPVFTRIDENGEHRHAGNFAGDLLGCSGKLRLSGKRESGIMGRQRRFTSDAVCTECGIETVVSEVMPSGSDECL